jgi:hypothetical protein
MPRIPKFLPVPILEIIVDFAENPTEAIEHMYIPI